MMDNSRNRRIGIMLNYFSMFLNCVIGIVFLPTLAKRLGQSEYGLYSLALAFVSMLSILDLGFNQAIVRYLSRYDALNDRDGESNLVSFFLRLYILIAFVCGVMCIGIATVIPYFYKTAMTEDEIHKLVVITLIFSINVCVSFPLSVFTAILNARECFVLLKVVNILGVVAKYGAMFIVLLLGYKVISIAIVIVIISIGSQLFLAIICKKKYPITIRKPYIDKTVRKEIYGFSFYLFINSLIGVFFDSTDKLLLGGIIGSVEVAVYNVGVQFITYFSDLSIAVSGVFLPHMTKLYVENNLEQMKRTFIRIGRIQYVILSFIMFSFMAYGQEFISLWLNEEYDRAFFVAVAIMVPAILNLTQNVGLSILRAMNLHKYRTYVMIGASLVNVLVSIPLLLKYYAIGAAIGTGIANIICCILMDIVYVKKIHLDIKSYWIEIGKITIQEVLYFVCVLCLNLLISSISWTNFFIKVVIGILIQIVLLWFIILKDEEKKSLVRKWRKL